MHLTYFLPSCRKPNTTVNVTVGQSLANSLNTHVCLFILKEGATEDMFIRNFFP